MKTIRFLSTLIMISSLAIGSQALFAADTNVSPNAISNAETKMVASKQKVNINMATAAELDAIKGIGPKRAQAIIAYRNEHGSFKSADELGQVKGIGKKRLAAILSQITVN